MGKKVISIGLNTKDINRAIREIEQYKKDIQNKFDLFRKRLAEEIANEAQSGFNSAGVDDLLESGMRKPDVTVTVKADGDVTLIVADGKDAVWVEFGAGVYHNGSAGSSPNPLGSEIGFTIGSYGKGYGKRQVWGFPNEAGDKIILTRGTPAEMPMYRAVQSVTTKAISIAREVFG